MIAKLTGLIDSTANDRAVVDVGGVGYLVLCSARTLAGLGPGEETVLHIETHVREDHINLYGFTDEGERAWFRLLITVQGVGARHALAILGVISPDELALAIAAEDKATISRANGVGPKLAQRIASELRDKIGDLALGAAAGMRLKSFLTHRRSAQFKSCVPECLTRIRWSDYVKPSLPRWVCASNDELVATPVRNHAIQP